MRGENDDLGGLTIAAGDKSERDQYRNHKQDYSTT